MNRNNMAQWLPLALALVAGVFGYGAASNRIDQNERAISQMQADKRANDQTLNQINERTARMEAKLEFLLPTSAIKLSEAR